MKRGDAVIAYGKYKAVIISDRLGFNSFDVRTEPVLAKPTDKRRKRLVLTVHESDLRPS